MGKNAHHRISLKVLKFGHPKLAFLYVLYKNPKLQDKIGV